MSKKYQVFISSTYQDLKDEREQVIKAVLEMGHIPVGMEMFSAADEEQWKIIARQIDEIDYYAIIVAHRYGSVTPEGLSFTEKEYDYAVGKGVPVLGFVIDDSAAWPKNKHEEDSKNQKRLTEFKKKIKNRLIQFWKNKEDLHGKFSISLMKAITGNPRTGWVRASDVAGPEVTKELTRLSSENATLRTQIDSLLRAGEGHQDEVRSAIKILSNNARTFSVRKTNKWDEATSYDCSLADVFHFSAPNLITENTSLGVAHNIALGLAGTGYFTNWPIGKNIVSDMIADLAALDLIEPSKKKHSVSDIDNYWSLTKLGKQVLKEFRRVRLEEGLKSVAEPPSENG
ncbi:DUF4062 domain-containing protein [Aromatoleum evansii]|uniref:DUF4062 domain-containing protein n=1 Tax=Aromatoleum evansii TaxID=59406 RepID=UPI00145D4596|nr:DUF4062 domain-containing protein [Aromatoleum evansii]NMG30369.1 DUF4062 domain-containing protein [Aromatoleum evansii]